MQNVEKRSVCIARNLPDFGFVHQGVVEGVGSVLLLAVFPIRHLLAVLFLLSLRHRAGNVKSHLHQLVPSATRLLPLRSCASQVAIRACVVVMRGHCQLNSHFVLPCQIGVLNFRVRYLESRSTLHVKRQFVFTELGLSPIPSSQRMLLVLEIYRIPPLERGSHTIEILSRRHQRHVRGTSAAERATHFLFEAIKLMQSTHTCRDL